jgi:hypothetical protein
MKIKFVVLITCLLIAHLSFSQRIQVEAGDTMAVVPIEQIRQANAIFVQKDSIQAEFDLATLEVTTLDSTLTTYQQIDQIQKDELQLQERRVSLFQTAYKDCKKESKTAKRKAFLVGISAGVILDIGIRLLALFL